MAEYVHVSVVLMYDNGTTEVRHSRYPASMTPQEGWSKLAQEVAGDLDQHAVLLQVLVHEDHAHPSAIGVDGPYDPAHMP